MHQTIKKTVLWILLIAVTLWIWSNSMATGEESGSLSLKIAKQVHSVLLSLNLNTDLDVLHFMIRKAAHFTEYFILGILAAMTARVTFPENMYAFLIPYMVLIPGADETIQRFVPGRGPSVRDVCIDMAGFFCGMIIILSVTESRHNRKDRTAVS